MTLLRDKNGHAKQYATPERAWKDAEKVGGVVHWVPMPRRPWRVLVPENGS